jgi:hypothetical protein
MLLCTIAYAPQSPVCKKPAEITVCAFRWRITRFGDIGRPANAWQLIRGIQPFKVYELNVVELPLAVISKGMCNSEIFRQGRMRTGPG